MTPLIFAALLLAGACLGAAATIALFWLTAVRELAAAGSHLDDTEPAK